MVHNNNNDGISNSDSDQQGIVTMNKKTLVMIMSTVNKVSVLTIHTPQT